MNEGDFLKSVQVDPRILFLYSFTFPHIYWCSYGHVVWNYYNTELGKRSL